jgi:hypothetical protein
MNQSKSKNNKELQLFPKMNKKILTPQKVIMTFFHMIKVVIKNHYKITQKQINKIIKIKIKIFFNSLNYKSKNYKSLNMVE